MLRRSTDFRLTLAALKAELENRKPPPGCVHYAAQLYRDVLAAGRLSKDLRDIR